MRFRSTFSKHKFVDLQRLVSALDRVGNNDCVMHLFPEEDNKVSIAVKSDPARPGSEVWSHLQADQWFEEYSISSRNGDHILLDLSLENLSSALRCADKAERISMRLAKNPVPCLNLEIKNINTSICHAVPVDVWNSNRAKAVGDFREPDVDPPSTLIWLPQLSQLCGLVEKMKQIDGTLFISAKPNSGPGSGSDRLQFRVETDQTSFETEFKVRMKSSGAINDAMVSADDEPLEVAVDIKLLAKALHCYNVGAKHAVMGILPTVVLMQVTAGQSDELQLVYVRRITSSEFCVRFVACSYLTNRHAFSVCANPCG